MQDEQTRDVVPTKRDIEDPIAGFLDWHPHEAIALEHMLDVIRRQYRRAGFAPLSTPLVERPVVLRAKAQGKTLQQIYGLRLENPAVDSPTDEKNLAIRFDHTVPLVRYVAANVGRLQFPFRRYDIGPVVRGERPKEGRYREFIQADIDVVGNGVLSYDNDAEMIAIINSVFEELAFGEFTIRVNNRKILTGFLKSIGCSSDEDVRLARDAIDEVEKVGLDRTLRALETLGISEEDALRSLELLTKEYSTADVFDLLKSQTFEGEYADGVRELEYVIETVKMLGVPEHRYKVDLSLARGLDYYTSTVYEAYLNDHRNLGSVAGGGRFDNLAERLSDRKLPGVGISIGVDRLLRKLIKFGVVKTPRKTHALVLVASRDYAAEKQQHVNRARVLRAAEIPTEVSFHQANLSTQIRDAVRKGIKLVVFTHMNHDNDEEQLHDHVVVRNVEDSNQMIVPEDKLLETIHAML